MTLSKRDEPSKTSRAWAEIDLAALRHNAWELMRLLPRGCEMMAVVKADAYGHGAVKTAPELARCGITAFAVATISEGLELRRAGVTGEILVLGYTNPEDAALLMRHNLSQMIVDGAYARALNSTGVPLNVHIAIDTGMHRLGMNYTNFDEIASVFTCENLTVAGTASHLSSSDSLHESDVEATTAQIEQFYETVEALRKNGCNPGKLHIQATYGIVNYPGLPCDYARAGIALYGVLSANGDTKTSLALRPVLSLRARVAEVRWIEPGETVSYGRTFEALMPTKIATITIGYADGLPRQMSGNGGYGLLHGKRAPILGRICMDLTVLDATEIDVAPGDIVTLIGSDGGETIRCEDVAERAGTITNDILCRLAPRVVRVYTGG